MEELSETVFIEYYTNFYASETTLARIVDTFRESIKFTLVVLTPQARPGSFTPDLVHSHMKRALEQGYKPDPLPQKGKCLVILATTSPGSVVLV